jgi:hypothetical protein
LRTRFGAYPDLEKAVALLVREDGRIFVPLVPTEVIEGERLKVVFTTEDGAVSVNRMAVVDSTTPDRALSGGALGVALRLQTWKGPAPQALPDETGSSFEEPPRNPLAGMDTNMVALLVECTLTESTHEVGRSYDDIPCLEIPLPAADEPDDSEPTRKVATAPRAGLPPLTIEWASGEREIVDDPMLPQPAIRAEPSISVDPSIGVEASISAEASIGEEPSIGVEAPISAEASIGGEPEMLDESALTDEPSMSDELPLQPARWRPTLGQVLIGGGLGLVAAAVMVLAPAWTRSLLRQPLPALAAGMNGSVAALGAVEPLPPVLVRPARVPPSIPSVPPEEPAGEATATAEEPAPAAAAPATCQVRLTSRPAGAEIWSEGRRIGSTPSKPLPVPCGAELVLKRPRYQPASTRAPAQPGGDEALAVNLVRPTASLLVTSTPEGAEVRLRGRTVGRTPATVTISRYESMTLEVRAPNLRSWKKRLYVRSAEFAVQADLVDGAGR